jgi:trimeric autotransporter adhesin
MKRYQAFLLAALCLSPVQLTFSQTALPRLVRFGGNVNDAKGDPVTGVASITFALYSEQTGGAPLWMETQNVTADSSGHYSALLGATLSQGLPAELFTSEQAHWVGVQVQGQPEQPRVLLVSAPYALKAGDAETIGGLPPSAFVLAAPTTSGSATGSASAASPAVSNATPAVATDVTTTGGTVGYLPYFNGASTVVDSSAYRSAAGIGIRGTLTLPAIAAATASVGSDSEPLDLTASVFNSGTSTAVSQTFQLKSEPVNNDTATAGGVLSLLYGSGTSTPAETGLQIASDGVITFAAGQTFPGAGTGTITGVTAGTGLSGGGSSGSVTLTNTGLLGLTAGTGILVGGSQQTPTVSVSPAVPLLAASNTFTGNQTVNGNLSASSYQIGGSPFASGAFTSSNAFLGFAGNTTMTGTGNTASGADALYQNTTGSYNTAIGDVTLTENTTGSNNTALGFFAGLPGDGSAVTAANNTFLGANTSPSTGTLSNATAIGANAVVGKSNALVLGAITGSGYGGTSVNVGIGTTAPEYTLHVVDNGAGKSGIAGISNIAGDNAVYGSNTATTGTVGTNGGYFVTSNSLGTGVVGVNLVSGGLAGYFKGNVDVSGALNVGGTSNFTGAVTFASGQTFPGTGTVTSVSAGTGLTGGTITGSGTLSIAPNGCPNGYALTALPLTCSPFATLQGNTFVANQTVQGNVTATGIVTAGTVDATSVGVTSTLSAGTVSTGSLSATSGVITNFTSQSVSAGSVSATGSVSAPSVSASTNVVGASAVSGSNSAISGTSNGGYFSTASVAGTAVVGVNSAGGYAGYFQGNAIVTGQHSTNTLSIGGDTAMSHNPRMVWSGFNAGDLYNCTVTPISSCTPGFTSAGAFNPDRPIIITRMLAGEAIQGSNDVGCIGLVQGTGSSAAFLYSMVLYAGATWDSGPISVPAAAGTTIYMLGTETTELPPNCTQGPPSGGSYASNVWISVEYVMQ